MKYTIKELKNIASLLNIHGLTGLNKDDLEYKIHEQMHYLPSKEGLMNGTDILNDKGLLLFRNHLGIASFKIQDYGLDFMHGSYGGVIFGINGKYRIYWTRNKLGIWSRPSGKKFISPKELIESIEQAWFTKFK